MKRFAVTAIDAKLPMLNDGKGEIYTLARATPTT